MGIKKMLKSSGITKVFKSWLLKSRKEMVLKSLGVKKNRLLKSFGVKKLKGNGY